MLVMYHDKLFFLKQIVHILIVKTSSLGDIVQTFPVITLLKKHYQRVKIDWVAKKFCCELVAAHPDVHHVISVDSYKWRRSFLKNYFEMWGMVRELREQRYDLLLDLQGNIKSACVTKCARARKKVGYTFSSASDWPNAFFLSHRYRVDVKDPITFQYLSIVQQHLAISSDFCIEPTMLNITDEEKRWVHSQIQGIPGPIFMVCSASRWDNKKLSLKTWQIFLKQLNKKFSPYFFFVWGSEKEREESETLHRSFIFSSCVLPRMSISTLQFFMDRMDVVLAVDSFALHLAATTSTSTYSIFGPSQASVYKPFGESHQAFQGVCPYGVLFDKRCPYLRSCKTRGCLKNIDPETLMQQFIWKMHHK